jgi:hypothetical protein
MPKIRGKIIIFLPEGMTTDRSIKEYEKDFHAATI